MLETLQVSPFGAFHTALSLIALAAGAFALMRDREIVWSNAVGKIYAIFTALTCLTGFGIFHHGGFGKPHALGIITLLALALAQAARRTTHFGRSSKKVEVVSYSATYFFHMIPTATETATRFPLGDPWVTDRDGPELQAVAGVFFLLFLIGAALQFRRMNAGKVI